MTHKIIHTNNFIIGYNENKPIVADLTYTENDQAQPVVIFCHGYKGYKDWGAWHLIGQEFAKAGFVFLKFNFSHNGGTFENPIDFPDLEAFGNDNYSKQMSDLKQVINFVKEQKKPLPRVNTSKISLIGHSRGGGIVCLTAYENQDVDKLVTWSSVSNYKNRFPKGEDLKQWQNKGVYYVKNGRTKQDMPHYYQFYEDFLANQDRFDIQNAVQNLKQPFLILHGEDDETVKLEEAHKLNDWCDQAELKIIPNATHTYNTKQPWDKTELSKELKSAVDESITFLKNDN
ncbi:S9 family peptidase [Flavobacterium sp. CS20]|uniref:alpha/beta hydrolase family protein n=1 Tax=Flavobacterium sp. CS20 TaxID=2775246 RepID=UPI001B39D24A|nr:alpha/beta fold hydrolase [Flavobacterium sp. CS20]QTY27475.1 alpha/beta hydrolase [Flavobacterium sp. CS20]